MSEFSLLVQLLGVWTGGGRLEILAGPIRRTSDGLVLLPHSRSYLNDPRMVESERAMTLSGNQLHYRLDMHTTSVPGLNHHVEAVLSRTGT